MTKKEVNKNGLVELFRFLCSVWVAYYHGFFPILSEKFDGVNISVDFFFMVSGFFFLKSIEKHENKSTWEGIKHILRSRIKSIIVPLIIAACSILACNIIFEMDFGGFNWPLSFLWFFAAQFTYLSLLYLIYKKVKSRSAFNIACAIVILVSMSLVIFMSNSFAKQFDRVFRAPAMLALGILVSQVPKITLKFKNEKLSKTMSLIMNIFGFAISAIGFIFLAYLPGYSTLKAHFFTCIVCPTLLYFATALPVRGKLFNLLGEISVFIYLAQCPILLHYYGGTRNTVDQVGWLCFYAVVLFVINRIANALIRRKKAIA